MLPFYLTYICHITWKSVWALFQLNTTNQNDVCVVFREALSDIFEVCDLDGNGRMNKEEFNWFNFRTSGEEVADEEWEVVEGLYSHLISDASHNLSFSSV